MCKLAGNDLFNCSDCKSGGGLMLGGGGGFRVYMDGDEYLTSSCPKLPTLVKSKRKKIQEKQKLHNIINHKLIKIVVIVVRLL